MLEDSQETARGFAGLKSLASSVDLQSFKTNAGATEPDASNPELRALRFTRFPRSFAGLWKSLIRILLVLGIPPAVALSAWLASAAWDRLNTRAPPAPAAPKDAHATGGRPSEPPR
ncbi:MAG TPA: hypothetical protein VGO37_07085 [Steroidobacteraceae bacterium]|nr:hypothetical protein [Steroidobacteraceae bacterium]